MKKEPPTGDDVKMGGIRRKIQVNGIVQGVGFRPFVFSLAERLNLCGFVTNTSRGVTIEVEGAPSRIHTFVKTLRHSPPPLAEIHSLQQVDIPVKGEERFAIISSRETGDVATQISPDTAVCDDCIREMFDPHDRRYLYPFINCTNCGPRYTITRHIPYDRPYTTMADFNMCARCREEYTNPRDRRFHAQPIACPQCGPRIWLTDSTGCELEPGDVIDAAIRYLQEGKILAVKGLGGFHLAVDATNDEAMKRLRQRKGREEKPFAIMVRDVRHAATVCRLSAAEKEVLTSRQVPIVLAEKANGNGVASSVAPGNHRLGIMLPYTPLHHLLMKRKPHMPPLVMTSANFSEEPICIHNEEALTRLKTVADVFLLHDRDIYIRSDDSVGMVMAEKFRLIRRSRGYAPRPVILKSTGPSVLAVGAALKNTVCLLKDDRAVLSQHIGDLENLPAYEFFTHTIRHLQNIFDISPDVVVHDLHPDYLSSRWAEDKSTLPAIKVQHHHAHLASCMAEHGLTSPVIGVIMDGTGLGTDGTIWGGEFLVGDFSRFRRVAYFEPMPLPGGDSAIRSPWKTAVAYLYAAYDGKLPDLPFMNHHPVEKVTEMITQQVNTPKTSSCGRLFDAVAAMSGGVQTIRFEGQAAIHLMQQAVGADVPTNGSLFEFETGKGPIPVRPLIRSVVKALMRGESLSSVSRKFHHALVELFTQQVQSISQETGLADVVLSGGVFQNHLLAETLIPKLKKDGFQVWFHEKVPANDGGISLGQALIGRTLFMNNS